jgi:hypothetical protein
LFGSDSSIVRASTVVAWLKERETRNRQIRARLESTRGAGSSPVAGEPVDGSGTGVATAPAATGANRPPGWQQSHPPRPRKKGKRK